MSRKLQEEFTLSRHAIQRLRERFPDDMKEVDFEQSPALRIKLMYDFLLAATVENRVIHDTMFMQYLQDKYGYDKAFKFFANGDMLFIGVMSKRGNCIVTVVNRSQYPSRFLRAAEKKIQKKPVTFRRPQKTRSTLIPTNRTRQNEYLETVVVVVALTPKDAREMFSKTPEFTELCVKSPEYVNTQELGVCKQLGVAATNVRMPEIVLIGKHTLHK